MPPRPVSDLAGMLAGLAPLLDPKPYLFTASASRQEIELAQDRIFALIHEDEACTCIQRADPQDEGRRFARITLMVQSDLDGVGLTAAVAGALAELPVACNVVAGVYHDHIFVPWERREDALAALRKLSRNRG